MEPNMTSLKSNNKPYLVYQAHLLLIITWLIHYSKKIEKIEKASILVKEERYRLSYVGNVYNRYDGQY
jgi:hypothetical protein